MLRFPYAVIGLFSYSVINHVAVSGKISECGNLPVPKGICSIVPTAIQSKVTDYLPRLEPCDGL